MSKLKIKNFGPIKEGFGDDGGFMNVKKVTVFIGNQGSGKSTVAKVLSTLSWMEKAMNRGDIEEPRSKNDYQQYFAYQGLKAYFIENTNIEYYGNAYNILYNSEESPYPLITKIIVGNYIVPKISYVPAERNFLSVIKNATGVRGLPEPLFDFAEELTIGQNELQEREIELPINGVAYKYDLASSSSYIIGREFKVNLLSASSGFQSLVPLFLVSLTLSNRIANGTELSPSSINVTQSLRMNEQVSRIMLDRELSDSEKIQRAMEIQSTYLNKCFINVVEEPEQNLFPTSQHQLLNSLLHFNNLSTGNKLIMTTHSPYLINYLTLAVKADMVKSKIITDESKVKLSEIVPLNSTVNGSDLMIYELDEKKGEIKKLDDYKGLPSDENDLNSELEETNEKFAQLQEIEKGWR
jgi:predicted ATPase